MYLRPRRRPIRDRPAPPNDMILEVSRSRARTGQRRAEGPL